MNIADVVKVTFFVYFGFLWCIVRCENQLGYDSTIRLSTVTCQMPVLTASINARKGGVAAEVVCMYGRLPTFRSCPSTRPIQSRNQLLLNILRLVVIDAAGIHLMR